VRKVDVIIVGQGIAGSLLSHVFLREGKSILVIDNAHHQSASKVAAGLYNPIVFKRLTQSWMAEKLIPSLEKNYSEIEKNLEVKIHHKKPIYRIFANEEDQKFWLKKSKEENLEQFLSSAIKYFKEENIKNEFGAGEVLQSGWLDIKLFINKFREILLSNKLLVEEKLDASDLKIESNLISWKDIQADKIIFCEGTGATSNPYFSWLPFKNTKGEVLDIEISQLQTEDVLNRNAFLFKNNEGIFKAGSTYEWDNLDDIPTQKGKNEILEKINKVYTGEIKVKNHVAGIRPTSKDRRPFIGIHPEYKNVGIFNGFGPKAVMIAPYFAEHFFQHLFNDNPLNKEASIERFYANYSSRNTE
jgi:glycine oxidase